MEEETEDITIYHIYNRGVEKREIFQDNFDRLRFINGLYLFNDSRPAINTRHILETLMQENDVRDKFVEVLAFVLMPNHFHLIVRPLVKNGLTDFMRKMGTGYTNYFNIKHDRVGALFQGKFKSVLIDSERQLSYLPYYIHLNPAELIESDWKEKSISDHQKVLDYLKNYRWSSFLDYTGKDNFPKIIDKDILIECLGDSSDYEKETLNWLKGMNFSELGDLTLE